MLRPLFLIAAVAAVGVLHTIVPDHWLPISLLAREHGWTRERTARAAFGAGLGHVISTLAIGLVVWIVGVEAAARYGHAVDLISGIALVGFGAWTAVGAAFEQRREAAREAEGCADDDHAHHHHADEAVQKHRHAHAHEGGLVHTHSHAHTASDSHDAAAVDASEPPRHEHEHSARGRAALLLVLGSSPMLEGIPAFFAASRFGLGLIGVMSAVFALSTIATYVVASVFAADRLSRLSIGPLERYGEVISGALIATVGVVFLACPVL